MERENTNDKIFHTAQIAIRQDKHNEQYTIMTIEQTLNDRRIQFLGHILRADNKYPIRAIPFEYDTANPIQIDNRRVGGPRQHWTNETMKLAWNKLYPNIIPLEINTFRNTLLKDALDRKF